MYHSGRLFLAVLSGLLLLFHTPSEAVVVPDLDDAELFTLLAMPDGSDSPELSVSSFSGVSGNLGVGPGGQYRKSGSGDIVGTVFLHPGATTSITGSGSPGTLAPNTDLSAAIADALAASSAATALSPTQILGVINSSQLLAGNGTVNVISATSIDLSGVDTLTLSGGASEFFIFNLSGVLELSGFSHIALAGGLTPNHILYNLPGTGAPLTLSASSVTFGTVLAPHRDVTIHGADLFGAILANDIAITSGGQVIGVPFGDDGQIPPPPPVIPEPATWLLLGMGSLGLRPRSRAK